MPMLALTRPQSKELVKEKKWQQCFGGIFIFPGVHAVGVIDIVYLVKQLLVLFLHFFFVFILILNNMTVTLSISVS